MIRALVTGCEGFVGKYLRAELTEHDREVIGMDRVEAPGCRQCDLLDARSLLNLIRETRPREVYHLAGQADIGRSWKEPAKTVEINTVGAAKLLEAIRKEAPEASVLLVGSSDQYGRLGADGESVSEDMGTRPQSPYAISKKAQEELGMLYARSYGMRIIATRSFNHGGAGQRQGFMIPDFAAGIVRVERGETPTLRVGNLAAWRDFTHVKDVVRAYRMLAEKGRSGEVYNVGSGKVWQVQDILEKMRGLAETPIPVEQDPARMRPSDTPVIRCDNSKLTGDTGWRPEHTLEEILKETLEWYRSAERL